MDINTTIDLVTALWLGFIGACVGSFLNVVAYRMPRGESVIWTPSHCPKCDHAIRAYDNVPVLGWLWLRGKCRDCREPISPRYAIVEFVMGAAFFILAYVELFSGGANLLGGPITEFKGAYENVWRPQWPLLNAYIYQVFLLSILMAIALIAIDGGRVPRKIFLLGATVGLVGAYFGIRRQLGLDDYSRIDWGDWNFGAEVWVSQAAVGGVLGWIFGCIVDGIWRQSVRDIDPKSSSIISSVLMGMYVSHISTFIHLFGLTFATLILFEVLPYGSRKEKRMKGGAELALFVAVLVLFIAWKQIDSALPLFSSIG